MTVTAMVAGAIAFGAAPALAAKKPVVPSQAQVDQANAAAHAKAVQTGQTEAQLAAANASLQKLNSQVELLIERYNGAVAKMELAQQAATKAQAGLASARTARTDAQLQMSVFAADSYRGSGDLGKLSALMTSDSPNSFLARASTLSALARHEQALISEMTATEHQQNVAQHAADQALSAQKAATEGAAKAKDTAMKALDNQVGQVALIKQQQTDLQAQLAVLKGTAKNLTVARADGLRRLAAEAAAARKAAAAAAEAARNRAAQARAEQARQAAAAASRGSTGGSVTAGGSGGSPTDVVPAGSGRSISSAAQRQKAVDFAQGQVGLWYRWAGAGEVGPTVTATGVQSIPGYDCSGLTMRAYQSAGISLGHYTGLQWDEGMHVSRDQLQPGDLVFFATDINDIGTIHHVGIYIGGGQMIDAPQTGEQIGVRDVFRSDYIGAVQP